MPLTRDTKETIRARSKAQVALAAVRGDNTLAKLASLQRPVFTPFE